MSATPKPKVRPVTRWMVAYDNPFGGANFGADTLLDGDMARNIAKHANQRGVVCRAIRVRITPLPPRKKAKKGARR